MSFRLDLIFVAKALSIDKALVPFILLTILPIIHTVLQRSPTRVHTVVLYSFLFEYSMSKNNGLASLYLFLKISIDYSPVYILLRLENLLNNIGKIYSESLPLTVYYCTEY